jgi:polar amino acid transport system substrate-binding protein
MRASPEILSILSDYSYENDDFLIAGLKYTDFQKSYSLCIKRIEGCSNRIDENVKRLKAHFSGDDPGHPMESLDINSVIRTGVELLEPFIKKTTENFTLQLENDIPKIKGNAQRLEQIIINLTFNACQSLTNREQIISICSLYDKEQNSVLVIVRDEGIGIPGEQLARIKDPFYTTGRGQGGTGLGLYISDIIIKEHRGTLSFESQQGKGTTATISLPLEGSL